MINISILTSEDNILVEKLVQYFASVPDAQISCVISNVEDTKIHQRLRRYKIKSETTTQYKKIDQLLTNKNTHYVVLANYNEKVPPNFCKKYNWKLINLEETKNGIHIFYEKEIDKKTIFEKEISLSKETLTTQFITEQIKEMSYNFYPSLIQNIIRETYKKIYKDND